MRGCDHLRCWSEDPSMPVVYHAVTNRYSLELSLSVRLADMYCMICGARDGIPNPDEPRCACGCLARWAADATLPIEYPSEYAEYHFVTSSVTGYGYWFIHYFPRCGRRMPKSKRGDSFPLPFQGEVKAIRERLKDAKTIDDVIRTLGEPDRRFVPPTQYPTEKKIYRLTDVRLVLVYRSIAKTAEVHIQENECGEITIFIDGKE